MTRSDATIHVLLVEDNEGDVRLVSHRLAKVAGPSVTVTAAERLSEGLRNVDRGGIDAVLLDLELPDSHGLDTIKQMHDHAPDLPIIVLTGAHSESLGLDAVKRGAQDYLLKGEETGEGILRSVRYAVERTRLEHAVARADRARDDAIDARTASEAKFRGIFENSPDAIVLTDADDRIVLVNAAAERTFGYARGELIGQPVDILVPEERREAHVKARATFHGSPRPFPMSAREDLVARRKDGTFFPVAVSLSPFDGGAGPLVITTVQDLTEHRQRERALRTSELRFAKALQASPAAIFIVRVSDGAVLEMNESASVFTGWTAEEARGHTSKELKVWDDPEERSRFFETFQRTGLVRGFDARLRTRSGELRHLLLSAATIEIDGEPARLSIGVDITDRMRAEEARKESDQRFHEIAESVDEIFWVATPDLSRLLYVNPAYERITGWSAAAFLADMTELTVHAHAEDAPLLLNAIREATASTSPTEVEYRYVRPDGAVRWIHIAQYPVLDAANRVVRRVGVGMDVTERKLAEEIQRTSDERAQEITRLSAVNSARVQFVNTLAHEIGNPLTPLILQTELLKMSGTATRDPRDKKAVHVIDSNLRRMKNLLDEALDVARVESNTLRLTLAQVDLAGVARDVVETYEMPAAEAGLILEADAAGPIPVMGDASRLTQVISNLVSNALKFTPRGGRIVVRALVEGREASVRVTDTGLGLSTAQVARLFKPFGQVHDPTAGFPRGTGLGLYISKGIIERQGGRISCASPGLGKGATFTITLPLTAQAP